MKKKPNYVVRKLLCAFFCIAASLAFVVMCGFSNEETHWIKAVVASSAIFAASFIISCLLEDPNRLFRITLSSVAVLSAFAYSRLGLNTQFGKQCNRIRREQGGYRYLYRAAADVYDEKLYHDFDNTEE